MTKKLIFGLILMVLGFTLIKTISNKSESKILGEASNRVEAVNILKEETIAIDTQLVEMGAVSLEITPIQLEVGKNIVFEVSMNTHSVDLDYDFLSVFRLLDQNDITYKVFEWTGGRGGHHLTGQVIFDELQLGSKSVILDIQGINKLSEQVVFLIQ